MVIAPFMHDMHDPRKHTSYIDWLILAAIHIPALLLTGAGIWQAKKVGRFMGMDAPLFFIAAAVTYGAGVALGFYAF
jgi:hypothetical protein